MHRTGALWLAGLLGCSSPTSTTRSATFVPVSTTVAPPELRHDRLLADVSLRDEQVSVTLSAAHFCQAMRLQREVRSTTQKYELRPVPLALGLTGVTLGLVMGTASLHAGSSQSPESRSSLLAGAGFHLGVGLLAGGAVLFFRGLNRHDDEVEKVEMLHVSREMQSCGSSPAGGLWVTLTLPDQTSLGGWTDASGTTRFPFGEKERASLRAAEGRGWLHVQGVMLRSVDLSNELTERTEVRTPRGR